MIRHGVGAGLRFDGRGGQPGFLLGTTEPLEQELLATALTSGDVFYDIGANVGFFSTLGARLVGASGRVYAFEPTPDAARQAARNAALNSFTHVDVVPVAVGRERSQMTLSLGDGSQTNRLVAEGDGVSVTVRGIDEWRAETSAPAPSFVMIDVEGAEMDVLAGMLGTIAEARPTIACEVHWLGDAFVEFVRDVLGPLGYTMRPLDGDPFAVPPTRWHAVLHPGPDVPGAA